MDITSLSKKDKDNINNTVLLRWGLEIQGPKPENWWACVSQPLGYQSGPDIKAHLLQKLHEGRALYKVSNS